MATYECYSLVTAKVEVEADDSEEAAQKVKEVDPDEFDVVQVEEVLPEDCTPK